MNRQNYWVLWTYVANHSKLECYEVESPEAALKAATAFRGGEQFEKVANIYVFDHPPALRCIKGKITSHYKVKLFLSDDTERLCTVSYKTVNEAQAMGRGYTNEGYDLKGQRVEGFAVVPVDREGNELDLSDEKD